MLIVHFYSSDNSEFIDPEFVGPFDNYQIASEYLNSEGYKRVGEIWEKEISFTLSRQHAKIPKVVKPS